MRAWHSFALGVVALHSTSCIRNTDKVATVASVRQQPAAESAQPAMAFTDAVAAIDVISYKLTLRLEEAAAKELDVGAEIEFRVLQPGTRAQLDVDTTPGGFALWRVQLDGQPVDFRILEGEKDPTGVASQRLEIPVAGPVGAPHTVFVLGKAPLQDNAEAPGFVRSSGIIHANAFPHGVLRMFPSHASPGDFATLDVTADIPSGLNFLGQGSLVADKLNGERRYAKWWLPQPTSPTRMQLAIGELAVDTKSFCELLEKVPCPPGQDKTKVRLHSPKGTPQPRTVWRSLKPAMEAVARLSQFLGPYPFGDLNLLKAQRGAPTSALVTVGASSPSEWTRTLIGSWWGSAIPIADRRHQWIVDGFSEYLTEYSLELAGRDARYERFPAALPLSGKTSEAGPHGAAVIHELRHLVRKTFAQNETEAESRLRFQRLVSALYGGRARMPTGTSEALAVLDSALSEEASALPDAEREALTGAFAEWRKKSFALESTP